MILFGGQIQEITLDKFTHMLDIFAHAGLGNSPSTKYLNGITSSLLATRSGITL